jgi:hypothetical protein
MLKDGMVEQMVGVSQIKEFLMDDEKPVKRY